MLFWARAGRIWRGADSLTGGDGIDTLNLFGDGMIRIDQVASFVDSRGFASLGMRDAGGELRVGMLRRIGRDPRFCYDAPPASPCLVSSCSMNSALLRETSVFLLICVIAAIALYAFGSRELFAWSWPLLVGVLILACAGSVLAEFNIGAAFYPRRLRIQFPLEFALFHWTRSQRRGTPDPMVLRYLRKARRAAGRTSPGARLDGVIDCVASGDPAAAKVAGELQAILRDLSVDRASRLPFRNYWVLPSKCFVPISFIVAAIGVVVAPATSAITPLTVDGFLQALVLFALTYEGLRLLRVITFKVHDVLSNRAFRVVIISTIADRTVASDLAEALYPEVAHVVHVLVDPEAKEPIAKLHPSGKYWFFTDSEGVSDVLAAVAANSDLFVLDGGGELLAQTVRATTSLAESRYLALSRSGSVPQGYRWIEPLALRAGLRSDPNGDPHCLSVLPGQSIWEDRVFQLLVFASLDLLPGRWRRHAGDPDHAERRCQAIS